MSPTDTDRLDPQSADAAMQQRISQLCSAIEAALQHPMRTPKDFDYLQLCIEEQLTNVSGNVYQTIANNSIYGSTIQVLPFVKPGDVDGNGEVNVTDASMVIGYILGKEPAGFIAEVADVDGNGLINVTDVSAIINIILGK